MSYKASAKQLQGVMTVVSLFIFGGNLVFLKVKGILPTVWKYLPGLSHTMFPTNAGKISPIFVSVTLIFPTLNLLTAGGARSFLPDTSIVKIQASDLAVYGFFNLTYFVSMWYFHIPFTIPNIVDGLILSAAYLGFQLIPYYALHYFDMPEEVKTPEVGVYDLIILLATSALFGVIASYAIGFIQMMYPQ